ncbi:MAG: ester cyclase [Caldilineaceae bacterium]|nr:ester cyclase [Caldilineaceae bacterium]HRJ40818.1 ester cyclase [Caldilineaceae bacterium]
MTSDMNLETLQRARDYFNAGDIERYITTLYAAEAVGHFLPPGMPQGHSGLRLFYGAFHTGFPDAQLVFDDILSEGERVVIRFHLDMTHTGEFNGIPATNKRASLSGITIFRFVDGKVAERWSESDFFGLMQQLGVIPMPG